MYPDSWVAEERTYTRRNQRHSLKLLSMRRQMITELNCTEKRTQYKRQNQ
jgi:hypothetical protein